MATIDHLKVSFLDLPKEEGMKMIHELRAKRRTPPVQPRKKTKRAKGTSAPKKKESKLTADQAIDAMSPEQKALLLKQLQGG